MTRVHAHDLSTLEVQNQTKNDISRFIGLYGMGDIVPLMAILNVYSTVYCVLLCSKKNISLIVP